MWGMVLSEEADEDDARKLGDLEPIDGPAHNQPRPELEGLSNDELMGSVTAPADGQRVKVRGNKVLDGNGRINEMKKRGFSGDTSIPVDSLPPNPPIAPWED
jgi:hypothetical protein